jgi:PAS domain S-box-containing protein
MSVLSWIYLGAFLVYIALAIVVIDRTPRSALNWFCFGFLLCFALWGFEDIFHNLHPLIPLAHARLFGNIGSIGGYSFSSLFLLSALVLTGRQKYLKRWPIYVPLAGLPVIFIAAQWTGSGGLPLKPGTFGWIVDWSPSVWTTLFPAYYVGFALLALLLIARFRRAATELRPRRQAALIFWTALASLILATLTDVVLASLAPGRLPELGGAFAVIWAFGLAVSMTRYGLMPFNVQAAADEIIATMLDSLLLLNPEGRIAAVNQSARDVLGYAGDELLDQPAAILFESAAEFAEAFKRVMNEVPIGRLEFTCRAKGGMVVPVSVSARMILRRGGKAPGSVWVLRDITNAKRSEQRLRESEEQYRTLVERASDGIVIIQDRLIMYANERAAALAGSTPGAMLGMPFLEYAHPDDRHELMKLYARRIAGEIPARDCEFIFRRQDGARVPLEANTGNISYRGQPATMLVIRDISGRRRAEYEIRVKNEELERLNQALQAERRKLLTDGSDRR